MASGSKLSEDYEDILCKETEAMSILQSPSVWVTRWVDYTSKYGLGYMLANGSIGVYFNDSTKIILSSNGENFEYMEMSDIGEPFYVDVTVIQQQTNLKSAPRRKLSDEDHVICCEDLKGKFVSRNHIFQKGTSRKLKAYAEARRKEISQRGGLKPSVYSFAMDTHGTHLSSS